ncbi:hypothetical protein ACTNBL_10375, partial [Enterococcus villorum]
FKMYNNEINDSKMDQLRINSLMADCERMVNELQEATKTKDPYLADSSKTKSPTISPQEEGLLRRNKDLSTDFNRLTQAINHLRGQANELQERLFWNKQFPGEKLPYNRHDMEADLDHIINDQLPKLEGERTFVQDEIIKEKNYIDSLVKDGKINASKAEAYINEYNEVINNFEESMNHFDNQRNKRERVENPSLSENTLTTATTPASPTPAINATPEKTTLAINATTPEQSTPAIKTATTEKSTSVMNVATTTESPTPVINTTTIENPNTVVSTATTEQSTTAKNNTTPESIANLTSETYIQRRNKILELKFDKVMQETRAVREQLTKLEDVLLLKKNHDFTFSEINVDLREQRDEIKNKLLPKLKNETILVQSQIMNEKNAIESLLKTGKMSAVEAEKYRSEYNKLMDKFELPRYYIDIESDNKRKKRDLSLEQSFSEKLANTATDNKEKQRLSKKLESIATNNKQNVLRNRSARKRKSVIAR